MNVQVEVIWRTLQTIKHSIMLHARVSDKYIHFALIYTTDNIFPIIPIKHLLNQEGETTTPHKLENVIKPTLSNLCILFCPCFKRKVTSHVDTKALNMRHQS